MALWRVLDHRNDDNRFGVYSSPESFPPKQKDTLQVSFCFGGSEGIRTPEPVKTTRFPIVPVMTTSIRFLISARLFASVFYILYFFERFVKYFIGLFSINLLFENRTIVFKQRAQIIGGDESPKNYSTVFL